MSPVSAPGPKRADFFKRSVFMAKHILKEDISDAIIERPVSFRYKGGRFNLYPLSLGKMQLCSRIIESVGIGNIAGGTDIYITCLSAAINERDKCIRLLSYVTLPGSECLEETKVLKRMKKFSRIKSTDLASVIVLLLSMDKTKSIMQEFGIDKEEERLAKVVKAKNDNKDNWSFSFGGKSIWGTIIDAACERYGWTYQYVLWGISFSALQLMMSDHVKTVIMSKDERKSSGVHDDGMVIRADNKEALRNYINSQNWN